MAVVARRLLARLLGLAHLLQALGRAVAQVRFVRLDQCACVLLVYLQPLRLGVGRVRPADIGTFVPVEAQPAERLHLLLDAALHISCLVRVLDAEEELPSVVAGEQPVEQRRAQIAEMGLAGRAGA